MWIVESLERMNERFDGYVQAAQKCGEPDLVKLFVDEQMILMIAIEGLKQQGEESEDPPVKLGGLGKLVVVELPDGDMRNVLDDSTGWLLSFNGHNPGAYESVWVRDGAQAFKLKSLIEGLVAGIEKTEGDFSEAEAEIERLQDALVSQEVHILQGFIVITYPADGGYLATCPTLHASVQEDTKEQALLMVRDAMEVAWAEKVEESDDS